MKNKYLIITIIFIIFIFQFCKNEQDIDEPNNETEIQADTVWRLLPYVVDLKDNIVNFAKCTEYTNKPFPALPWSAKTKYTEGAIRSNAGNLFKCVKAGESSDTGPSQRISGITDGTVIWDFLKTDRDIWAKSTDYKAGIYIVNQGYMYVATTSGKSATTGKGPDANSETIQDGSIVWGRVKLKWVDALNGQSANSGDSPENPLNELPLVPEAYTHYQVAAGSVFNYDVNQTTNVIKTNNPWVSITVYDRSTQTEISDQPSPYLRALDCEWVSQNEIDTKYFSLICNCDQMIDIDIPWSSCFIGYVPSNTQFRLRGAYIKGFNYGALVPRTGGWWDVSDCILKDNKQIQTEEGAGAGWGMRLEGYTTGGCHSFTRLFIDGCGEDAIWGVMSNRSATDWLLAESSIHHYPEVVRSKSHVDCIQLGRNIGNVRIKRVVIEHDLSKVNYSDDKQPIGAAIIFHNDGQTVFTETWEISDCIIVTNQQGMNIASVSSGIGYQRNVCAILQDPVINGKVYLFYAGKTYTLTDCVIASGGTSEYPYYFYGGVKPTLINCQEITGITYPKNLN